SPPGTCPLPDVFCAASTGIDLPAHLSQNTPALLPRAVVAVSRAAPGRRPGSARRAYRSPRFQDENTMQVGVPNEIKTHESRVAMIPVGVEELTRGGHKVLVQSGAGQGSGISDEQYAQNGAEIVRTAEEVWKRADLIVKVKEPLPVEWPHMKPGQLVFTYFHF